MKYLICILVIILSSCSLISEDEPYDPGIPSTPIEKSIPYTCDGINYVKMIDNKEIGFGGPYMMMSDDIIYSLYSNKLYVLDCNKLRIISSHEISDRKVCSIGGYVALKNSNFWLFYSTYTPNTNYPNYELLSLIDSTGKAIHTFDFESDFTYAHDVKFSPTSNNGCILAFVDFSKLYIYNFDENAKLLWKKILPCDYNPPLISSEVSKVFELKSKKFLYFTKVQGSSGGYPQFITNITKLDKNGDIIWSKYLSSVFTNRYPINRFTEQSENCYLISSCENLIKVDSTGTIISQSESADNIYSNLLLNRDGGIISGYNIQNNGGDIAFSKISDDGKAEWTKTYGGTGVETLYNIFELNSGGYYLIGSTLNYTGKWEKILMTRTEYPHKQYYIYQKEYTWSYYFIKTDNNGGISNQ